MDCSTPASPILHYLPEFVRLMSIEAMMPSHLLAIPFSCLQSFLASGSFLMSWPIASAGQSIGAAASVFPVNFECWFPLELTGLISSVPETLKNLPQHHNSKAPILQHSAFFKVQLSHPYVTTGKTIALAVLTFVRKVMSLLLNMLSRFVIAFLPKSKHLLFSWL